MAFHQQGHGGGAHQPEFHGGQVPQQHLNAGQQRQMPTMQQKASQGQQQARNPYVDSIPQLSLWTFEKPSQSSTWDGVKPRKEYVSQEEIQEKLARLKRDDETVTDRLDATKSRSCRAEIRNFVEDQNAKLKKENKLGEYIIAGMMLSDHRQGRKDKQKYPHRVQVILQIEETSLPNVPNSRLNTSGLGTAHGAQDFNKPMKANNPLGPQGQGSLQNQGLNMNQQQRPVQQQGQHGMGGQHFEQRPPPPHGQVPMHHGNNPPPPPPPPPGHPGQMNGHGGIPPPPPPHPMNGHMHQHQTQHQHGQHQQPKMQKMPGTYPGTPIAGMRHVQPGVHILNGQKPTKQKLHHVRMSDDDWDTETSSGSEQWQTRSVSDDFAYVEDRGRGRSKPIKHGKQHVHKSRSRVRSRSVSQRRRQSSRPRRGSSSSENRSHTRATYASSSDESRHGKKFDRWVRPSPTRAYNNRRTGNFSPPSPMSRRSSQDSWTDATSSVYSDERDRRDHGGRHTRTHSRTRHEHRRPSIKKYETVHNYNIREPNVNDYPHDPLPHRARDPYSEGLGIGNNRPLPHRAATMPQMPGMPSRAYGYAQQPQDYLNGNNMYASQPQHYMPTNIPVNPDRFTLEELRLKLDQLKLDEQRTLFGPGRDTFEDFTTLRNQLNNAEQRARLGQNRYTLDEFREMFNERGQRAPLGRGQNDRVDPGLYYDRADPRMAQRQGEQRRPAFLDDEYSDPRYAGSGAAYDPFRV
ncbi:hypothetical protein HBH82_221480 [Parastagonospora nodorum]|nr:hypothetical protein HBH82_221480 [Parastagonospora nodorum]KAH4664344.1 hypothetical protein HBH78_206470 [Parastagonospora nodorum]KAH4694076.1 hypothetical protein HBH67_219910 [Parastagonospora nodorum]KAH4759372.1 hypothetical protein HBH63_220000 [Parastagonospora nodorum]KAH4770500.1 hypothetical protein HBH62_220810 [Parastagonospora nodorum]